MCQCSTVLSKRLNHQIFPFTLPVTSLVYRFVTYKKIASFCIAFLWPLSICPSYPPQVWILDLFLCPLLNKLLLPPLVPHQQAPHSFFLYSCQLMHYPTVSLQLSVTLGDYTLLGLSRVLDVFTFLMVTTEDM